MDLQFNRSFDAEVGETVEVTPGIRRLVAPNPGPMTFRGTNTYLLGEGPVVVVDPGPADPAHLRAIIKAIGGVKVDAILVTHTHRDHTALCADLQRQTSAPILGAGKHTLAVQDLAAEMNISEAADTSYDPEQQLFDGDIISVGGLQLEVIETPGHTMNHLAFSIGGSSHLLSGDHVMGWSTTMVGPPDGDMTAYLDSLRKLQDRPETVYLPGHGAELPDAGTFVERLLAHRLEREDQILTVLRQGPMSVSALVQAIYANLDSSLMAAAKSSTLAHLIRLEALSKVCRARNDEWQHHDL